jgi:sterol desaturase/sphingolipid hydroxylase (fatty acid hydroxylase superfamily)
MHRIHHSVRILERDSNYGTVFSLWDRLAGTLVRDVDQEGIVIGVGGHNQDNRTGFHHLLAMPAWPPAP